MWAVVKPLRPHALSVGQARNFCTRRLQSVLDGRGTVDEAVADTAAIASELVTNAVTAGSTQIELHLRLLESSVLIEVFDNAAGTVAPAQPSPDDPAGRGLLVVAGLSRQWGVDADDGTKSVWAEVELPPAAAAS